MVTVSSAGTAVGSSTKPIYVNSSGVATAGTYTLAAACAKGVTDSSSASAISTGTSLTTERDVYYGLPTINGSHTYNSSTNYYAPTSVGTSGYVLTSSGDGAPTWEAFDQKIKVSLWSGELGTLSSITLQENAKKFAFLGVLIGNKGTDNGYAVFTRLITPISSSSTQLSFYGFCPLTNTYSEDASTMLFTTLYGTISDDGLTITFTNKIIGTFNFSTGSYGTISRSNVYIESIIGYY